MRELILFTIDKNHFAIDLNKIKRIVQAEETTRVAGNAPIIEGVFRFEDNIISVLNYRKMIGIPSFESRLESMLPKLKLVHTQWVEALVESVQNTRAFSEEINPYECPLGKWLGTFNSYNETISHLLSALFVVHAEFHAQARSILHAAKSSQSIALKMIESEVKPKEKEIISLLNTLMKDAHIIANSMQKFLILDGARLFAVRIDAIDDIINIDEEILQLSHDEDRSSYVNIDGIFEYEKKLVNLIGSINLPKSLGKEQKGN